MDSPMYNPLPPLLKHLERWGDVTSKYGFIVIDTHVYDDESMREVAGRHRMLDTIHGFTSQYLHQINN